MQATIPTHIQSNPNTQNIVAVPPLWDQPVFF